MKNEKERGKMNGKEKMNNMQNIHKWCINIKRKSFCNLHVTHKSDTIND